MQTRLIQNTLPGIDMDAVVVLAFEDQPSPLDALTAGWVRETISSGEFSPKPLETALLHRPAGLKARRLLLIGCGTPGKFDPSLLRKAAGTAFRLLKSKSAKSIALYLDQPYLKPEFVKAAVEGGILGDYEGDQYKTDTKDRKTVDRFCVVVPVLTPELEQAASHAAIIAESQNFTRSLVEEPGNVLSPRVLAGRARDLAAEYGLECEVLEQDRMKQLGMGSLLGVAQGSAEPPALIILRYRPVAAPPATGHLALIGKGVTFDTGGISIKPADNMEKMKYDMAGGGAVLGAMRALARLQPPIPVTALIPAVENMPGARAQRPGDIVTSLSGKTIEVLNTDAEGRLILVDAIEYAKRQGCTHLVDAATLTGAIVVALGHVHVGAFSNNCAMLARVLAAAKAEGENMWHMPLDEEYKDYLKSAVADLPNIGGRAGGSVTAAYFLKEFAGDTPWVHLDIAGTAWLEEAKPFMPKGASGVCVRTFVNLAMNWI
jgi:leucyl aminopeptidase